MMIFGLFGLIGAYLFRFTKETLHSELPSVIEELETTQDDMEKVIHTPLLK